MSTSDSVPTGRPFDEFLAAAEAVAAARPEVDPADAREVLLEAATMLHNGLVLDHLDDHDADLVVAAMCEDLCAEDPAAALRTRAQAAVDEPGDLHDPDGAAGAYLTTVALFRL